MQNQEGIFNAARHRAELVERPAKRHRPGARPYVGRNPVTPQRMLGATSLPPVSLPTANPTRPAAVAAPGPALDPEDPSSRSHGFIVWPPNQISLSARAPRLSLATSTAPASFSRRTTVAFAAGIRSLNGSAP